MQRGQPTRRAFLGRLCALCAGAALPAGCATYRLGNGTLYAPDIRTVYVPVFESNSYRRNLGERLTEAIIKEIELKTPYKVVGTPDADSVLSGRILQDTKRILVEAPTDEGRLLQANFVVAVQWVDRRGDALRELQYFPLPDSALDVSQTASLMPEVGHSVASSQQQALQRLAGQIVGLMEEPW